MLSMVEKFLSNTFPAFRLHCFNTAWTIFVATNNGKNAYE